MNQCCFSAHPESFCDTIGQKRTPPNEPALRYANHTPFGRLIENAFEKNKVSLQVAIEVHSSAEATFLVMAGAGVALVDPIMTKPYTLPSIAVKPFQPEVSLPLQLVFGKGQPQSRTVAQFVHELRILRK